MILILVLVSNGAVYAAAKQYVDVDVFCTIKDEWYMTHPGSLVRFKKAFAVWAFKNKHLVVEYTPNSKNRIHYFLENCADPIIDDSALVANVCWSLVRSSTHNVLRVSVRDVDNPDKDTEAAFESIYKRLQGRGFKPHSSVPPITQLTCDVRALPDMWQVPESEIDLFKKAFMAWVREAKGVTIVYNSEDPKKIQIFSFGSRISMDEAAVAHVCCPMVDGARNVLAAIKDTPDTINIGHPKTQECFETVYDGLIYFDHEYVAQYREGMRRREEARKAREARELAAKKEAEANEIEFQRGLEVAKRKFLQDLDTKEKTRNVLSRILFGLSKEDRKKALARFVRGYYATKR